MIRKAIIIISSITLGISCLFALEFHLKILQDETNKLNIFKKFFARFDSTIHDQKAQPPVDTARISIPVYEQIPETETTADYQHRIGAYQAWLDFNYKGIIDSLKLVVNPNDVDWRLLANSYYRLNKIDSALIAGEKIQEPDSATFYALGLLAMTLKYYNRAAGHFMAAVKNNLGTSTIYARLGDVYYLTNDHTKAQDNWLEAKRRGYNEPYMNYFIGFIYFEKRDLDKASGYFANLDNFKSDESWLIRAKYFQALIQEMRGSREAALEILSEIKTFTFGISDIEYDILKKKIYSHFWLGLKNYSINRNIASEHFINASTLIEMNKEKFRNSDKIVVELLNGVLQRLFEDSKGIAKHTLSSQLFHSYTETWLNSEKKRDINEDLMRISAEILYHCQEPILAARFFNNLKEKDYIAEMNYYILQPKMMSQLPEYINHVKQDTLAPYIMFNYMGAAFQKGDYLLAESLFSKTIDYINKFPKIRNRDGLLYATYFYRSRWLEKQISDKPEQHLLEMEKINKILNNLLRRNPGLSLMSYFHLVDGRIFILAVNR